MEPLHRSDVPLYVTVVSTRAEDIRTPGPYQVKLVDQAVFVRHHAAYAFKVPTSSVRVLTIVELPEEPLLLGPKCLVHENFDRRPSVGSTPWNRGRELS